MPKPNNDPFLVKNQQPLTELVLVPPAPLANGENLLINKQILNPQQLEQAAILLYQERASETGLYIPEDTTKELLVALLRELGVRRAANHWHFVDAMEHGERKHSETYDLVCRITGWSHSYCQDLHHMGRAYRREDRLPGLPIAHYFEAWKEKLPYPQRVEALRAAHAEGWTVARTKGAIIELLKLAGVETKQKLTGAQLARDGEDLKTIVDQQAERIRQQQAEIDRQQAEIDRQQKEIADQQEALATQHKKMFAVPETTASSEQTGIAPAILDWHERMLALYAQYVPGLLPTECLPPDSDSPHEEILQYHSLMIKRLINAARCAHPGTPSRL